MSKALARFSGDSLDRMAGRNVPARIERAVENEVAVVHGRAIIQANRTQAVEYVTHSALRAIEDLTDSEGLAIQRNPLGESRYRALVDQATSVLARIVAETGRA